MIYNPGLLTGQLSGAAGSTVAGANPYATVIYPLTQPSKAKTKAKGLQQDTIAGNANKWRVLSAGDVTNWNSYGSTVLIKGRLGLTYKLTGYLAYQRQNANLALIGQPSTSTPPINPPPARPALVSLVANSPFSGTPHLILTYSNTPLPGDAAMVVYAYPAAPPGGTGTPINTPKVIAVTPLGQASPIELYSAWQAVNGDFNPGDQISVKAVIINTEGSASGRSIIGTVAT